STRPTCRRCRDLCHPDRVTPSLRGAVVTAAVAAAAAVALAAAPSLGGTAAVGVPPPGGGADAGARPAPDLGLRNSRANPATRVDARDVAQLKQVWTFKLPADGFYAFTSNPVVAGGIVYLEDPQSDVFALSLATGKQVWQHDYDSPTPSGGPNGVAYGYGLL